MLSLAPVSARQGLSYYTHDNYYATGSECTRWLGRGCARLGLENQVDAADFERLLNGYDVNGRDLLHYRKENRRAALDLTFSAPKSVSIQALVFGDKRLIEAHRIAVETVVTRVEKQYCHYRETFEGDDGKKTQVSVNGSGMFMAQFEHSTSRAQDPQLHSHHVIFNMVLPKQTHPEIKDESLNALDFRPLYLDSKLLGLVYQNELAYQVRELGYEIETSRKGTFELKGFRPENLRQFSKRRRQIEEQGATNQKAARSAVLKNRRAKGHVSEDELKERWSNEARHHGISPLVSRPNQNLATTSDELVKHVDKALEHVTEQNVVFSSKKLLEGALTHALGLAQIGEQEAIVNAKVLSRECIAVPSNPDQFTTQTLIDLEAATRQKVSCGNGQAQAISSGEAIALRLQNASRLGEKFDEKFQRLSKAIERGGIFSTEPAKQLVSECLEAKRHDKRIEVARLISLKDELWTSCKPLGSEARKDIQSAFSALRRDVQAPTQGQLSAIATTLGSQDQVIMWQGVAGAGKTFSVRAVVQEALKSGYEVKGFAPSRVAAVQLSTDAGIPADTLAKKLMDSSQNHEKGKRLWIIDEAGMVSARDMAQLLEKAEAENARLLLVGDTRQLSAVQAGNPFLDLQEHTSTNTLCILDESVRQKNSHLRQVVKHLNNGQFDQALDLLGNDLIGLTKGQDPFKTVAKEYLSRDAERRQQTAVIARTNKERQAITEHIREGLVKKGELGHSTTISVYQAVNTAEAARKNARLYDVGDMLIPHRNFKSLGLEKDVGYELVDKNEVKNTLVVQVEGKQKTLHLSKVSDFTIYRLSQLDVAPGDRLISTRNVRNKGLINNETFKVESCTENVLLCTKQDGTRHHFSKQEPQFLDYGWVLTAHKSQGQTFEEVIQFVGNSTSQKELLVGITRASERALLFHQDEGRLRQRAHIDDQKLTTTRALGPMPQVEVNSKSQRKEQRMRM